MARVIKADFNVWVNMEVSKDNFRVDQLPKLQIIWRKEGLDGYTRMITKYERIRIDLVIKHTLVTVKCKPDDKELVIKLLLKDPKGYTAF